MLLLPLAGAETYARTPAHLRAEAVIAHVRRLNDTLHRITGGRHARCLREIVSPAGAPLVPREQLPLVAEKAIDDGSIFYNPEELDRGDCLTVLEAAWEGIPLDLGRILPRL
jgi:alcohol dehydrogenase